VKASGKSWIWFESAILGDGGATPFANNLNYATHPDPNIFNNVRWLGFRKWVLESVGLDPAHHPQSTSIVINDKDTDSANPGHKDRRRIVNTQDLVMHLKKAFPYAQVCITQFPLIVDVYISVLSPTGAVVPVSLNIQGATCVPIQH
jgi:hypothetical protein